MTLRAVLFDVDFTLSQPGPALGPEGYAALGLRHGLALDTARHEQARTAALERFRYPDDLRHDDALWVDFTEDIIRGLGGVVVAAGSIVDRSGGNLPDFGCPFVSLIQMTPETFPADALPEDLVDIPAVKPGSK